MVLPPTFGNQGLHSISANLLTSPVALTVTCDLFLRVLVDGQLYGSAKAFSVLNHGESAL